MKEKLKTLFGILDRSRSPIVVSVEIHVHVQDGANVIVADGDVNVTAASQEEKNDRADSL